MKHCKQILDIVLRPDGAQTICMAMLSGILLTAVFQRGLEESVLAYSCYALSAYSLVMAIPHGIRLFGICSQKLNENAAYARYKSDPEYKIRLSIHVSLAVTAFYSAAKAAAGLWYGSAWLGALALYYTLLTFARYLLFRYIRKGRHDRLREYRLYRLCAFLLLILTLTLAAISFHAIYHGRAIKYPGYMIYAAAVFTFYSLTMAIINQLRYRSLESPVFRAGKQLSFASAFVSLYFLQCSLFSVFGDGSPWEKYMNIGTGMAVFALIAADAVYMIRKCKKYLGENI